jgi:ABC-type multidrug transport system ATPase subunit
MLGLKHKWENKGMKITVRNLGAIKEAEFDLKPLTILIGPNNAGKTWLAYTLAGIFGHYGLENYLSNQEIENIIKHYPPITEVVDKLMEMGGVNMNLVQFARDYGEIYFNQVARQARQWLPEFLGTQIAHFDEFDLFIAWDMEKTHFLERILQVSLQMDVGIPFGADEGKPQLSIEKKSNSEEAYIYTSSEGSLEQKPPRSVIERRLILLILSLLHTRLYSNVAVLPTERTTFVTMPFNALAALISRMEKMRESVGSVREEKTVDANEISLVKAITTSSIPVSEYGAAANRASTFGSKEKAKREKLVNEVPQVRAYMELAHLLEDQILKGKVDFSTPEPEPTRAIYFKPEGAARPLELSVTSSMVKELTPLVFYLRYFATPGQLLIIDEPEMNLHPEAQVKIIEFLAMLVTAGLYVLVTTHSPYVVDHLLNLRKASEYTDQGAISDRFFLQSKDAFISQQKSAVYLVDDGKIKNILDKKQEEEEEQEEEDTFGKISDRISEIYFSF